MDDPRFANTPLSKDPYAAALLAQVEAVLGSVADGVLVYDEEGRIVRSNAAAEKILGYDPRERAMPAAERIRNGRREWFAQDGRPLEADEWPAARAARHGETHRDVVLRMRTAEGERWLSVTAAPLSVGGERVGAVVTLADVTERNRAEEAQARLAAIVESTDDAIISKDLDGRIRSWNAAAERVFGHRADEVVGRSIEVIIPPEHRDEEEAILARIHAGERVKRFDTQRVRKDGTRVDVSVVVSPVRDGKGRIIGASKIVRDVTGLKRAAAALLEALASAELERSRLSAVLDALPAGVAIADATGRIVQLNDALSRIWGSPPGQQSAMEYREWRGWWADGGEALRPSDWAMARAVATGEPVVPGDVVEIEKLDGSGRATLINAAAPIRNARGGVVGGVLAAVDVTAQKRTEEALRASQQLLRSTMDHFPTVIAFKDRRGRFIDVNQAVEKALGLPKERIVGRAIGDFVPAEAADALTRRDVEVMESQRAVQVEEVTPLPSGTLYHLDTNFPLVGADGRVYGTGHISHDITELKRAEGALREANEKLREADRRKDEFLGMLSHELRNPLAPVRNALYILDHAEPAGQQARRAKDVASRQLTHLTRLVDDLLDVTRIARGKIELRHEDLDLAALARRTAEDYRPLMQDRGLELAVEVPREPVVVNGDPTRLTQILGNLLSNAAKFTPAGGRVALALRADDGDAVVRVRDTGAGIEPDLLESIFDPFTQARQTLARSEGGLGLGLALVKGLVALHGGDVRAISGGPGRGTDFVITLPRVPTPGAPAVRRGGVPAEAQGTRRRRVLVVDDNKDAADTLAQLVELLGHEAEVALDGTTALNRARVYAPDIVLCDVGLPGMDGYEVARRLRADGRTDVRLVAVSGYAQPEDVKRAADAGFDVHVAKPVDPEQIERLLD